MSYMSDLWKRLKTAGIEPGDSDDIRLRKSLLMFAMGLTTAAPVLWLVLYQSMGLNIPTAVPIGYQLVSLGTLAVYLVTRNFDLFRSFSCRSISPSRSCCRRRSATSSPPAASCSGASSPRSARSSSTTRGTRSSGSPPTSC
jgi:hypothetical protein